MSEPTTDKPAIDREVEPWLVAVEAAIDTVVSRATTYGFGLGQHALRGGGESDRLRGLDEAADVRLARAAVIAVIAAAVIAECADRRATTGRAPSGVPVDLARLLTRQSEAIEEHHRASVNGTWEDVLATRRHWMAASVLVDGWHRANMPAKEP